MLPASLTKLTEVLPPIQLSSWIFFVSGELLPFELPRAPMVARHLLLEWIKHLPPLTLEHLDGQAESLWLLSDAMGAQIVNATCQQMGAELAETCSWQRAIWLLENHPAGFAQALVKREKKAFAWQYRPLLARSLVV